jgi:hypothetical protein
MPAQAGKKAGPFGASEEDNKNNYIQG